MARTKFERSDLTKRSNIIVIDKNDFEENITFEEIIAKGVQQGTIDVQIDDSYEKPSFEFSIEEIIKFLHEEKRAKFYERLQGKIKIQIPWGKYSEEQIMDLIEKIPSTIPVIITGHIAEESDITKIFKKKNVLYQMDGQILGLKTMNTLLKTRSTYNREKNTCQFPSEIIISIQHTESDEDIRRYLLGLEELYELIAENGEGDINVYLDINLESVKAIYQAGRIADSIRLSFNEAMENPCSVKTKIAFKIRDSIKIENIENLLNYSNRIDQFLQKSNIEYSIDTTREHSGGDYLTESMQSFEEYSIGRLIEDIVEKNIPSDLSDLDKVVYVTSFLANYFKYNYKQLERYLEPTSSQAILFANGYGICQDIAMTTARILERLGIRCEYISGEREDFQIGDTDAHAFNMVYIDNKPYWLDVTWVLGKTDKQAKDALIQGDSSENFLVSDETFRKKHKRFMERMNTSVNVSEDFPRDKIAESKQRVEQIMREYSWGTRQFKIPENIPETAQTIMEIKAALAGRNIPRASHEGPVGKKGRNDVISGLLHQRLGLMRDAMGHLQPIERGEIADGN